MCAWRILSVWQAGHIDCHDGVVRPAPINRQDFDLRSRKDELVAPNGPMKRRYTEHQEPTGSWSVLDTRPERPAGTPSRVMVGLSKEDAFDATELLNKLDAQRPGRSRPQQRPG